MIVHLPKWVATDRFEIQARAEGNPMKAQMRLMMQSLLLNAFNWLFILKVRESAVFALILVKPGKTGPKLLTHAEGSPCEVPGVPPPSGRRAPTAETFPPVCEVYGMIGRPGRMRLAGTALTSP
jgi:uncharacterized protein (TIGR03435 family)